MGVTLGARGPVPTPPQDMVLRVATPDTDAHLRALDAALAQLVRIADSVARTAQTNAQIAGEIRDCCQTMMAGQQATDETLLAVTRAVDDVAAAVTLMGDSRIEVPITVQPADTHMEIVPAAATTKTLTVTGRDKDGRIETAELKER